MAMISVFEAGPRHFNSPSIISSNSSSPLMSSNQFSPHQIGSNIHF